MEQIPASPQKEEFEPGMKVRLLEGSFKDFTGVIKEVDPSSERAVVIVNFFTREIIAEFDFSQMTRQL